MLTLRRRRLMSKAPSPSLASPLTSCLMSLLRVLQAAAKRFRCRRRYMSGQCAHLQAATRSRALPMLLTALVRSRLRTAAQLRQRIRKRWRRWPVCMQIC